MTLAIQFEFLVTPQLADPAQPEWGEWPPAPDRVFQALVATAAETGRNLAVLTALEHAPSICASVAMMTKAPLRYVPDNFRRSSGYHQGAARYLPTVLPDLPVVTYLWQGVPETVRQEIADIARAVTHLGRAASLVRAQVVDPEGLQPIWLPDAYGENRMRCPHNGRLNLLQQAYAAGLRSPPAQMERYRRADVHYPLERWGDLMSLRPSRQLDGRVAVRWTEALRSAIMASIAEDIPPLVSGHASARHVAWAAIPDVGHKYAQGGLLGLGCWLPADISQPECGLLWEHLNRLPGVKGVQLVHDRQGLKGLDYNTWASPSCQWGTITPIALDRWPKKNYPAEQVIADSLCRMGLPSPLSIECSSMSAFLGACPSNRYHSRKQNRQLTHAVIRWEKPVAGPLLVGADRFFGGGLCRPITPLRRPS